jgi:hypothetical protein
VWTLATEADKISDAHRFPVDEEGLTPERLASLREALGAFLETPLVTVEAYRLPPDVHISGGQLLDAASPLAIHLANLVKRSPAVMSKPAEVAKSAETLYRMVVPRAVAAQMGAGLVRSMPSAAVKGGMHSAILGKAGILGQASFVPVATVAGATGVAGAAGVITVAAPFILLAIATAASVYAEEQRRRALQRVTELLEELQDQSLNEERDRLNGAARAIEKATALLFEKGEVGHSLGLDSAVNSVDTALASAIRRAATWRSRLDGLPSEGAEVSALCKAFPGIDEPDGRFRIELRLASLAIAMKRRVAVLQAVEHAQMSPDKTFVRFTAMLKDEQATVDEVETTLRALLADLADLRLRAPNKQLYLLMARGEVNDLLKWPGRLRELAAEESVPAAELTDLEVGLVHHRDGKLRVLPMAALPRGALA